MAEEGVKVILNVYDLSQGLARHASELLIGRTIEGIWHTGIVVYGNEYYFGGGIQNAPVGMGPHDNPVHVKELGVTYVPQDIFETYLEEISPRYTAASYSLLNHNCNNFTNEVSQFLVGCGIPEYILDLPSDVINSPMGSIFLPLIDQVDDAMKSGGAPDPSYLVNLPLPTQMPGPDAEVEEAAKAEESEVKVDVCRVKVKAGGVKVTHLTGMGPLPSFDPAVFARMKVRDEIGREFGQIMASGTVDASEAAVLAARKVIERHDDGPDAAARPE